MKDNVASQNDKMMEKVGQKSNEKPIQTLQELAQNLKEDCYYFVIPYNAGDAYYLCLLKSALEQKHKGKIIFVIKHSHEAVLELFADENYLACENAVIENFLYPKWLETDNAVSMPTLGKLYLAHGDLLQKSIIYKNVLDFNLKVLDLPKDIKGHLPTNLPKINTNLQTQIQAIAPLEKIILFAPEANSYPCLPPIIFQYECKRLLEQGYKIIVNIPTHKQYLRYVKSGVYDLNLSLKEAIALALSCAGVISTRSGFCDIIAPHCKNLTIYHTAFYFYWVASLRNVSAKHSLKEVLIYDTPIYKHFLQAKRRLGEFLPLKLYKRYATKGFLRKLRTPFTLYFKIYRRHKNVDSEILHDEQICEFIINELNQSYEYQLGLALQKACERFFAGGFFVFPFDYLNLRRQKKQGKLRRINESLENFI